MVEVQAAVSETLGIPWVNTIAADRLGGALHADVTAVPNVSAEKVKACSTPISGLFAELAILLDGSKSGCEWDAVEGTPVPGLFLAGDWTDTGLPGTIEGAVRSGHAAADAVRQHRDRA